MPEGLAVDHRGRWYLWKSNSYDKQEEEMGCHQASKQNSMSACYKSGCLSQGPIQYCLRGSTVQLNQRLASPYDCSSIARTPNCN